MKVALSVAAALVASLSAVDARVAPASAIQHAFSGDEGSEMRVIELAPNDRRVITEDQKMELIRAGTHFMDVTDFMDLAETRLLADEAFVPSTVELPPTPRMPTTVFPLIAQLRTDTMKAFLQKFTEFHTRYYRSGTGAQSAEFLFQTISAMVEQSGKNITLTKFEHSWKQFSIIARFEPKAMVDSDTVIVGAHQDSVNAANSFARAPGADDDGSGTTTTLEVFRVLAMDKAFVPERPLEFHWYSGEEAGLLGSQAVASHYKKTGRKVVAMLQNDMTGYVAPHQRSKPIFGVVTDYVDRSLTQFIKQLIGQYADMAYVETRCGYGCSDHASWYKAGYRSAFPFEGKFGDISPYVHSTRDTVETVDFDHMKEFAKLALSFAVELSHA